MQSSWVDAAERIERSCLRAAALLRARRRCPITAAHERVRVGRRGLEAVPVGARLPIGTVPAVRTVPACGPRFTLRAGRTRRPRRTRLPNAVRAVRARHARCPGHPRTPRRARRTRRALKTSRPRRTGRALDAAARLTTRTGRARYGLLAQPLHLRRQRIPRFICGAQVMGQALHCDHDERERSQPERGSQPERQLPMLPRAGRGALMSPHAPAPRACM